MPLAAFERQKLRTHHPVLLDDIQGQVLSWHKHLLEHTAGIQGFQSILSASSMLSAVRSELIVCTQCMLQEAHLIGLFSAIVLDDSERVILDLFIERGREEQDLHWLLGFLSHALDHPHRVRSKAIHL